MDWPPESKFECEYENVGGLSCPDGLSHLSSAQSLKHSGLSIPQWTAYATVLCFSQNDLMLCLEKILLSSHIWSEKILSVLFLTGKCLSFLSRFLRWLNEPWWTVHGHLKALQQWLSKTRICFVRQDITVLITVLVIYEKQVVLKYFNYTRKT